VPVVTSTTELITVGDLVLEVTTTVTTTVVPHVPAPDPIPVDPDPDTVRIGSATYALAGINPTAETNPAGAKYPPSFRGTDQIIAVAAPAASITTNRYGCTVVVGAGGLVLAVRDDMPGAAPSAPPVTTAIPADGLVLAGHGKGRDFLLTNAKQGGLVQLVHGDSPPQPRPVPVGRPTVAGYLMDGQDVDTIPDCYNEVRVAFIRGSRPLPVEWGGKTPEQTQAQLQAWVKGDPAGRRVLLSVGGSGGGANLSSPDQFTAGFRALEDPYAATGLDYDEEDGLNEAAAIAVGLALTDGRRLSFRLSLVPPGGPPVDVALRVAVALQRAGCLVQFGFQGYDAVDSDDDILGRTATAVAALGAPSVQIGFMVGDDPKHRTPAECESLMRKVVARWPDIGGAYFWQIAAPGTTDAAQRVARVLGL
jgi:hypothetical protein